LRAQGDRAIRGFVGTLIGPALDLNPAHNFNLTLILTISVRIELFGVILAYLERPFWMQEWHDLP
jgi:hypothetical protein